MLTRVNKQYPSNTLSTNQAIFNAPKLASHRTKRTIQGYIRQLQSDRKLPDTPLLVEYVCLAYYCGTDHFAKARNDCFKLSADRLTLTNIEECPLDEHAVYLYQTVPSDLAVLARWEFQINALNDNEAGCDEDLLFFGLASTEGAVDEDFMQRNFPNCGISDLGTQCMDSMIMEGYEDEFDGDLDGTRFCGFGAGNLVVLTLNTKKQEFSVHVEKCEKAKCVLGVRCGAQIQYKLAVQMKSVGSSITLKGFEISKA